MSDLKVVSKEEFNKIIRPGLDSRELRGITNNAGEPPVSTIWRGGLRTGELVGRITYDYIGPNGEIDQGGKCHKFEVIDE